MSDQLIGNKDDSTKDRVGPLQLTAGAMLRSAREASGLHIAALAVSMKIPVKKLEALEADKFDLLLDAVFVRALAASVCRALKIDPTPVLEKLPQNGVKRLNADQLGINAPFHTAGQSQSLTVPEFLAKPGVLFVAALLVGAVVLLVLPEFQSTEQAKTIEQPIQPHVAQPTEIVTVTKEVEADLPNPIAAASAPIVPEVVKAIVVDSPKIEQPEIQVTKPEPVLPQSGVVVFKAKGQTWVEVKDSGGGVLLRKTLATGDKVGATGPLPLSVVIGRVDAVDVEVKGKPFSLAGIAIDNVARFEVK